MALILENITKQFGDKIILNNFSFSFEPQGLYSFVGESGTGKTTLLRIICGLDTDFSGKIFGGGTKNTSVMFQEYRLFPQLSALENAIIPTGDITDKNLLNTAKNLFFKLGFSSAELNYTPDKLSGGMKQRVSFVRALLRDKPVLILDEPTKELDDKIRKTILNLISLESKKRLVILITHNKDELCTLGANKIYLNCGV